MLHKLLYLALLIMIELANLYWLVILIYLDLIGYQLFYCSGNHNNHNESAELLSDWCRFFKLKQLNELRNGNILDLVITNL